MARPAEFGTFWPAVVLALAVCACSDDTTLVAPAGSPSKADTAGAQAETQASADAQAGADAGPPSDSAPPADTADDTPSAADVARLADATDVDDAAGADGEQDVAVDAQPDPDPEVGPPVDADDAAMADGDAVAAADGDAGADAVADAAPEVDTGPPLPDVPAGTCVVDGNCDDKNQCTDDKCQADGTCLWNLKKGPCEDGNACTVGDVCDFLKCKPGAVGDAKLLCNDGNSCTTDACDATAGCAHINAPGPCDDGNPCTTGEICDGGACKVPAVGGGTCDDGKPCTTDNCDLKTGSCLWTAVIGACEDGDLCTTGDLCKSNQCVAGPAKACADNNDCTTDSCDSKTGQCAFAAKPGAAALNCDGTVTSGRCVKAIKADLTFANAEAACVNWGGHLAHVKSAEDNAQLRGIANTVCGNGAQALIGLNDVQAEGKFTWTDGSAVTYTNWGAGQPDNCVACCNLANQGEDIVHLFNDGKWNDLCYSTALPCYICDRPIPAVPCNDAGKCVANGLCVAGACSPAGGGPPACEDGNPCTTDACLAAGNCTFSAVADGTACGNGGKCSKGLCSPGADLSNPATNCAAVAAATPGFKSMTAWIDPDGKAGAKIATQTLCDPATTGPAWTLLAVVSDDGQATFTWNAKDAMWGSAETAAGSLLAINKDYRSPLLGSMPISEVYFVHASGAWARYPLGKGTQSLGQVVAATAGPVCYTLTGAGIAMAAGTIAAGGKLCDTNLYLNADDHDSYAVCTNDNDPEPAWGPAWNVNREAGCFDDPGWGGSLGPVKSEAATEGGTAQPEAIGFGWALGLNKGTAGTATNWMRVYGR